MTINMKVATKIMRLKNLKIFCWHFYKKSYN